MKLVFAGSPTFAVPTLERLAAEGYDIRAVITQPDRPVGREQQWRPPPVKDAALRLSLPVFQPEKIKSDESRAFLEAIQPEAVVVVGYGQILPPWLLELPRYGCVNLHASLLPAYRGAAPIQWAIANGETTTGLTTMLMDPGLDTGPILLQWETNIAPEETAIDFAERLSMAGADLMVETLQRLEAGTITPQPQDNSRASRAPLLKKEHGQIDWSMTAQQISNRVRGFLPWPGCYTGFRGKKLQIWRAQTTGTRRNDTSVSFRGTGNRSPSRERERPDTPASPGELLVHGNALHVTCGASSVLEILEVQLEGRRRMTAAEFLHGARPQSGERLQSEPIP